MGQAKIKARRKKQKKYKMHIQTQGYTCLYTQDSHFLKSHNVHANNLKFRQKQERKNEFMVQHYESKHLQRGGGFLFPIYCGECSLLLRVVCKWLSVADCFWVRDGGLCPLLLSVPGPILHRPI